MKAFLGIVIVLFFISCNTRTDAPKLTMQDSINLLEDSLLSIPIKDTSYFNKFIKRVKNYQSLAFIAMWKSCPKEQFNIDSLYKYYIFQKYLDLFDALNIDSTKKIEYIHTYNSDAGRPVLVLLDKNEKLSEFKKKFSDDSELFKYEDSINVFEPIHINDNEKGYFQYLILYLTGGEYALWWHSNYGGTNIITSEMALDYILNIKDDFHNFSNEERSKIENINPNPSIVFKNGFVIIKIITFNSWEGFIQSTYKITRTFPHRIELVKQSTLVEYDCNIMF